MKKREIFSIIFAFSLIAVGYYIFKRDVTFFTIKLKVTSSDNYGKASPTSEYIRAIFPGDTEKNILGQNTAEIRSVETSSISPEYEITYVTLKAKGSYSKLTGQYSLKGRTVNFGQELNFNFSGIKLVGIVVDYPGKIDKSTSKKINIGAQVRAEDGRQYADTYGVPEYIAKNIKPGQTMTDGSGNILAKVVAVDIRPAERTIISESGSKIVFDPKLKDVFLKLELTVKEANGRDYFLDAKQIVIGSQFPLDLKTIILWPTITDIYEPGL